MTNCNIIRDLLTLYVDDLCSEESRAMVDEHLPNCPDCRDVLTAFHTPAAVEPVDEQAAIRRFGTTMKKRNLKKILLSTLAAVLCIAVLAVLMWVPEFPIGWYDGLAEARIPVDGGIDVHINAGNYKNAYAVQADNGDGTYDVYITAVNNVVTALIPNRDETVDFVRLGNHLCVSYKNFTNSLLFAMAEGTEPARIYYVSLSEQEMYAAAIEESFDSLDRHLLWEAK